MASLKYFAGPDLQTVTIGSNYTAGDGVIHLSSGHGARLNANGDFWLTTTSGTPHTFKVTARSTDDVTVTAAQDGTADANLAAGTVLKWDLGVAALGQLRADLLPTRATMWGDEFLLVTGSAPSVLVDLLQSYGIYYVTAGGNGDAFSSSFMLAEGTYTLAVFGITNSNSGILDWYIDGVKVVSSQDWYSASIVRNVKKTAASITVSGNGRHVLKGVANGKTGSGYYAVVTKAWLYPATDVGSV